MKFQIKHKWSSTVLFELETSSLLKTVVEAVKNKINLEGANLTGANLTEANLTEAYLTEAYLTEAYLGGANLTGAYLGGANLTGANLRGTYLRGAYLTEADLRGTYLERANLEGANLTEADLTGTYLTEAYLGGANLTGANLRGTYLRGAYLRGAYFNLHEEKIIINNPPIQIDGIRYWIIIWDNHMKIGCQFHSLCDWWKFDDRNILEMAGKEALKWWKQWKEPLQLICKNNNRGVEK